MISTVSFIQIRRLDGGSTGKLGFSLRGLVKVFSKWIDVNHEVESIRLRK
ncbi:MAG TPA: hypothetical protein VFG22_07410 [Polyangiales bacterium]|nr:hypothetical protein [Polyangiales bacterium]